LAKPQAVEPVKLFVAVLWAESGPLEKSLEQLSARWGEIDFASADYPFNMTEYYESEMGQNLKRRLVSFRRLASPDCLSTAKHICNDIEDRLSGERGRTINLDIGYLDHNKIVLASFKGAGQKIYLANGVWADMVARYRSGKYCPFEWTFPDFRDGRYDRELLQIRQRYLEQLHNRSLP
jgi:hypothetical protein